MVLAWAPGSPVSPHAPISPSLASPSEPHTGSISLSHTFQDSSASSSSCAAWPSSLSTVRDTCDILLCYNYIQCFRLFPGSPPGLLPRGLALVSLSRAAGQDRPLVVLEFPVECLELGFTVGPPCGLSAHVLNYLSGAPVWGPAARGVMDFTVLWPGWLRALTLLPTSLGLAVCPRTS